jgi:hypothetical protein
MWAFKKTIAKLLLLLPSGSVSSSIRFCLGLPILLSRSWVAALILVGVLWLAKSVVGWMLPYLVFGWSVAFAFRLKGSCVFVGLLLSVKPLMVGLVAFLLWVSQSGFGRPLALRLIGLLSPRLGCGLPCLVRIFILIAWLRLSLLALLANCVVSVNLFG